MLRVPSSLKRDGVVEGVASEVGSAAGVSALLVPSLPDDEVEKEFSQFSISASDCLSFLPVVLLSDREAALPNIRLRWSSESAKLRCADSAFGAVFRSFPFWSCSLAGVAGDGDDDHSQPITTSANVFNVVCSEDRLKSELQQRSGRRWATEMKRRSRIGFARLSRRLHLFRSHHTNLTTSPPLHSRFHPFDRVHSLLVWLGLSNVLLPQSGHSPRSIGPEWSHLRAAIG